MHVAILDVTMSDASAGSACYGPFTDPLEIDAWWDLINTTLDLGVRRAARYPVSAPFDLTDDTEPVAEPGQAATAQQALPGADETAAGFVVRLTDPENNRGAVVGTFPTRNAATEWWDTQAAWMDPGTIVQVFPILQP